MGGRMRECNLSALQPLPRLCLKPTTEDFWMWRAPVGHGISNALGLGGFTNLDNVRNPEIGPTPYVACAMIFRSSAHS